MSYNREYAAQYYQANKERIAARTAAYHAANPEIKRQSYERKYAKRKDERRAMLDALKNVPCMDCGGRFPPVAMDFDHVRGVKLFDVSQNWSLPKERVMEEIAKCEVVCANCHRIRTELRRNEGLPN